MPKNQEFLLTVRVYVRSKDIETATKFGQAVRTQAEQMAVNFVKHRVSQTGTGLTVDIL